MLKIFFHHSEFIFREVSLASFVLFYFHLLQLYIAFHSLYYILYSVQKSELFETILLTVNCFTLLDKNYFLLETSSQSLHMCEFNNKVIH